MEKGSTLRTSPAENVDLVEAGFVCKTIENHMKFIGNYKKALSIGSPSENHRKPQETIGTNRKPQGNHRTTIGQPSENYRNTIGNP